MKLYSMPSKKNRKSINENHAKRYKYIYICILLPHTRDTTAAMDDILAQNYMSWRKGIASHETKNHFFETVYKFEKQFKTKLQTIVREITAHEHLGANFPQFLPMASTQRKRSQTRQNNDSTKSGSDG